MPSATTRMADPLDRGRAERARRRKLHHDLRVLAKFVAVYCGARHHRADKKPIRLKTTAVPPVWPRGLRLCPSCGKLLAHALVKRVHCPLEPKPSCKKCPTHCFAPSYRARIREAMKYSGRRLVLQGRLDYLFHLIG